MKTKVYQIGIKYAKLHTSGLEMCENVLNEISEFKKFGITEAMVKNTMEELKQMESDILYLETIRVAGMYKKQSASELTAKLAGVKFIAEAALTKQNPLFDNFRNIKVSGLDNEELFNTATMVCNKLQKMSDVFTEKGIDISFIQELALLTEEYKTNLFELNNAKRSRLTGTSERLNLAMGIKDRLLLYCKIGRSIWKNRDLGRYKSYNLLPRPPKKNSTSNPQNSVNLNQPNA